MPYLLSELRRLKVDIVALSVTQRPGSVEISVVEYFYYWSGMSNGFHVRGVVLMSIPVSCCHLWLRLLQLMIV